MTMEAREAVAPTAAEVVPEIVPPLWWPEADPVPAVAAVPLPETAPPVSFGKPQGQPAPHEGVHPMPLPEPDPPHPMFHGAVPADGFAEPAGPYGVPPPGTFAEPYFEAGAHTAGPPAAPASAPAEESFGWEFEEEDPAHFAWENPKPKGIRRWWPVVLVSTVSILAVALTSVYLLMDEKPEPPAPPPLSGPPASAIDPGVLPDFQARHVSVGRFEGRLQVTWEAPVNSAGVVGYAVVAQNPAGELLEKPHLIQSAELITVFTGPSAVPGTCVVVTTIVRVPNGTELAKGGALCPDAPAAPPAESPAAPPAAPPAVEPEESSDDGDTS